MGSLSIGEAAQLVELAHADYAEHRRTCRRCPDIHAGRAGAKSELIRRWGRIPAWLCGPHCRAGLPLFRSWRVAVDRLRAVERVRAIWNRDDGTACRGREVIDLEDPASRSARRSPPALLEGEQRDAGASSRDYSDAVAHEAGFWRWRRSRE